VLKTTRTRFQLETDKETLSRHQPIFIQQQSLKNKWRFRLLGNEKVVPEQLLIS
jgi:hypothetical protein